MFLGSGDLRYALYMAAQCSSAAYHELNIHLSDSFDTITAKNFLMAQIILSDSFHPSNPADMQYLWDLWYGCKWDEITRRRFIRDVNQFVENQFTNSSVIPHGAEFNSHLQRIFKSWLATCCNMNTSRILTIMMQRYT